MATTISIANQKGGVGKTTTSLCLANTLGFKGYKTLLIDCDGQGNSTYASGIDEVQHNIIDVFNGDCKIEDTIVKTKYIDIIGADSSLKNIDVYSYDDVKKDLLKKAIQPIQKNYDFIILDTPPSFDNLLFNAMTASDYILIPTEPSAFAMTGLLELAETIRNIQNSFNPNLKILGILLIKYAKRLKLNQSVKEMLEEYVSENNGRLFETTIRDTVSVKESQLMRMPLIDYKKDSFSNIDYKGLTTEILRILGVI
ncbi:MAG: ParA family protein [bacterium]|nr:ParA family protein [bacterium]